VWLVKYVPVETKIGFMRIRRMSFPFSAVLSILSVVLFLTVGMNFGIDFKGGTFIELQAKAERADVADIRNRANALGFGDVEVQEFGTPRDVSVRVAIQEGGEAGQQAVVARMREAFVADYDFRRTEVVGPRVSGELVQSGTIGVLLAILGVLIYLWFRFEWQFAVGAVIATMHDLVLTIGFFVVTQLEFNMTSIAAILTILGYSLNDTVVVYDRIRESLRKYKRLPISAILDDGVNATLSRTILTGLTTFFVLIALAALGGEVIKGFALAILFGLVVGTYSSVFIAAPILIYLGLTATGDAEAAKKAANAAEGAAAGR
jgi:preprotein translocase SecF subunit